MTTCDKRPAVVNDGCGAPPRDAAGQGQACSCAGAAPAPPRTAATSLDWRDRLGALRVRLGIRRMNYRVAPGLYAVGRPDAAAPVLVSANYKLSFDHLRRALPGRDAWILVLDTRGINVWCAAGKGLLSTGEVIRSVEASGLRSIVSHRRLVLPQLAGPGVAAHEVRRHTGFHVIYGPVRAADLPAFLDLRMKATPAMRRVRYGLRERAVLVPVEVVAGARYGLLAGAAVALLGGVGAHGFSLAAVASTGSTAAGLAFGAFLAGAILGPLLLPWLPGRAFSFKGALLGLGLALLLALAGWPGQAFGGSWQRAAAWVLLLPAITSFVVMNFTGSSTYTSLSGVLREMRVAMPLQVVGAILGLALWIAGVWRQ